MERLDSTIFMNYLMGLQSVGKTTNVAAIAQKLTRKRFEDVSDFFRRGDLKLQFENINRREIIDQAIDAIKNDKQVQATSDRVEFRSDIVVCDNAFAKQRLFRYNAIDDRGGTFSYFFAPDSKSQYATQYMKPTAEDIKKYQSEEGLFKTITLVLSTEQLAMSCPNYNQARCSYETAVNCEYYKQYQCSNQKTTCSGKCGSCKIFNAARCVYYNRRYLKNALLYMRDVQLQTKIPVVIVVTKCAGNVDLGSIKVTLNRFLLDVYGESAKPKVYYVDSVASIKDKNSHWHKVIELPLLYLISQFLRSKKKKSRNENRLTKLLYGDNQMNYDRVLAAIETKLQTTAEEE